MSINLSAAKYGGIFIIIFGLLFSGIGLLIHNLDSSSKAKETSYITDGVTVDATITEVRQEQKRESSGTGKNKRTSTYTYYTPVVSYTVESSNQTLTSVLSGVSTKNSSAFTVNETIPIAYMDSNPSDIVVTGEYGANSSNAGAIGSLIAMIIGGLMILGGIVSLIRGRFIP